jgi:hypothetical protein
VFDILNLKKGYIISKEARLKRKGRRKGTTKYTKQTRM